MADSRKIQSELEDRQEGVRGTLLTNKDNEKQLSKLDGLEFKQVDATGNPPAKSQNSSTRHCPQCSERLFFVEVSKESGDWIVECHGCHKRWTHSQLESPDIDWLYRMIPQDLVMRWMDAREDEMKRKGIWTDETIT